mgnify:CR=1 FL=1
MKFEAVLGKMNRIVIPKKVVRELKLSEGDKLVLEIKSVIKMGTLEVKEIG